MVWGLIRVQGIAAGLRFVVWVLLREAQALHRALDVECPSQGIRRFRV